MAYDPASGLTRDKLRLTIGDTNDSSPIFTDAELDLFISLYGTSLNFLAAHCMLSIANTESRLATVCSIGNRDYTTDRSKVAEHCRKQAAIYFEQDRLGGRCG